MTYNWAEIGARIKAERTNKGLSLEKLASDVYTTRQTLANWEKGKGSVIDLGVMLKLCEVFDCELGYLLCEEEYKNKTKQKTDICNDTGLSEKAVSSLCSMSPSERKLIDDLLSSERDLSSLALSYNELKRLNKEIKDITPVNADWFAKTQSDLEYIRFTLSNNFSLFAEKEISEGI